MWQDLQERVVQMEGLGIVRALDMPALLDQRMIRITISLDGDMKRIAAIYSLQGKTPAISLNKVRAHLSIQLERIHGKRLCRRVGSKEGV